MVRLRQGSKRFEPLPRLTRAEMLAAIDALSTKLAAALPEDEVANGWTTPRAQMCLGMLKTVRAGIEAGNVVPYTPIGKTLDHSNISKGELLEEACRIEVALNHRDW